MKSTGRFTKKVKYKLFVFLFVVNVLFMISSSSLSRAGWGTVDSWSISNNYGEITRSFSTQTSENRVKWEITTSPGEWTATDSVTSDWIVEIMIYDESVTHLHFFKLEFDGDPAVGDTDLNVEGDLSIYIFFQFEERYFSCTLRVEIQDKTAGVSIPFFWSLMAIMTLGISIILIRKKYLKT